MKCVIIDYFKVILYKNFRASAFSDSLKSFSFKILAQVLSFLIQNKRNFFFAGSGKNEGPSNNKKQFLEPLYLLYYILSSVAPRLNNNTLKDTPETQ